jgi:hypothetical protein
MIPTNEWRSRYLNIPRLDPGNAQGEVRDHARGGGREEAGGLLVSSRHKCMSIFTDPTVVWLTVVLIDACINNIGVVKRLGESELPGHVVELYGMCPNGLC